MQDEFETAEGILDMEQLSQQQKAQDQKINS